MCFKTKDRCTARIRCSGWILTDLRHPVAVTLYSYPLVLRFHQNQSAKQQNTTGTQSILLEKHPRASMSSLQSLNLEAHKKHPMINSKCQHHPPCLCTIACVPLLLLHSNWQWTAKQIPKCSKKWTGRIRLNEAVEKLNTRLIEAHVTYIWLLVKKKIHMQPRIHSTLSSDYSISQSISQQ